MSVASFFERAATHAELLLSERSATWPPVPPHRSYRNRASELATRALTRAMVVRCKLCEELIEQLHAPKHRVCGIEVGRLQARDAEDVRGLLAGWVPEYQHDVPGQLRTFARLARERGFDLPGRDAR